MPVLVRRLSLLLLILGATPAWPDAELARRFEAASPAVVTIRTVERSPTPGPDGAVAMRSTGGLGSGVLIDDDGLIATAAHVVQTAEEVAVSFEAGTVLPARILASEVPSDLALLRVERVPDGVSPAKLADAPPPVGEDIFVVGAPFGIERTLSRGIVSGLRTETSGPLAGAVEYVQTDASINTGNSGGPMFDMRGRVVGIVSSIISRGGGFDGIGIAVSVSSLRTRMLDRSGLWLGFSAVPLENELTKAFNIGTGFGLLIQQVANRSPSYYIGLEGGTIRAHIGSRDVLLGGDVLVEIMGVPIDATPESYEAIQARVEEIDEGERIEFVVIRDGERVVLATSR